MLRKELIEESIKNNIELAIRIRRSNSVRGSSPEAYAFIISSLKMLYPNITDRLLQISITDGDRDGSIDTVVYEQKENIVSIYDFKNSDGFGYKVIQSYAEDIKRYVLNPRQPLEGLSENVIKHIKKIRRLIHNEWKMRICIVRNGNREPERQVERIIRRLKGVFPLIESYNFVNIIDLLDRYLESASDQNDYIWPIQIISSKNESDDRGDKILIKTNYGNKISALFVRLRLIDVVKLQKHYTDNMLNLFDANVREFQKKKNLSSKILYSLRHHASLFHLFHNGITFSCNGIEKIDLINYKIACPQIINGCQTVNTLYEEYKEKLSDNNLRKATVLCRFYALPNSMIEKVCEATNTQIKISLWDLRSNDKIQKLLEQALRIKGIEYKRKTGSKKEDEVYITDLAQWVYSCKYRKPAMAKNKKNMLFDIIMIGPLYKKIFNENMGLEDITTIYEIASFVKNKIKKTKKESRSFEESADLHFMAALYFWKRRRETLDVKYRKIHKIITEAVKILKKKYGSDINYNNIFTKKEETWEIIQKHL